MTPTTEDNRPNGGQPDLFGIRGGAGLWIAFALVKLLTHLTAGPGYGYFRDEFYYLACSDHLAWGYVDHPPLSILILGLSRLLFGESVIAIRLLPALAGAATVFVVGMITRDLGGRRFAQALAMTTVLIVPIYLGAAGYYSMNGFDLLFWTVAAALLVRILDGRSERLWPVFGVVLGLGLLNKISLLWFGFGLFCGLVATAHRRRFLTRGPWIAAGIGFLIFLPHVIWQVTQDWPTLEFIRNATGTKMREIAPVEFFIQQLLSMHPLTLPVSLSGLVFLLMRREGARWRPLGVIWLAVATLLLLNSTSRPGYLAPAYVPIFAAGGVQIEQWLRHVSWRWVRPAILVTMLAGGALLAPFSIPLLPVETYIRYAAFMGIGPSTSERKELAELPQHYADMFGWNELVDEIERVYRGLDPEEQRRAGFFVYNYGEAGAIDLLGQERGLPRAMSGHNNYWMWGPPQDGPEVVIVVGGTERGHLRIFEEVEVAGVTACDYCMPYENDQTIYVLRKPRVTLKEIWPSLRHYD